MADNKYSLSLPDKRSKGNVGEDLAAGYLQKHGYKILERNFHARVGEIDIIALDGQTLVFVEVKTRWSRAYGGAIDSITYRKLQSIIKTAQYYKLLHPQLPEGMRIDIVAVDISEQSPKIELIKNAFC